VRALVDGGSQLCVVNSKVIDALDLISIGNVLIKGITGDPITCNLYKLHIVLTARDLDVNSRKACVKIVCAACDDLNEQLILTLPVADQLCDQGLNICQNECDVGITVAVTTRARSKLSRFEHSIDLVDVDGAVDVTNADESMTDIELDQDQSFVDVDDVDSMQNVCGIGNCDAFALEQQNDKSLAHAFQLARKAKSNYLLKNGLLFRRENYCGKQLVNLVVPKARKVAVLRLAHDSSLFGGVRTFERIITYIKK
jgi:hypothetical protein